jgi:hypothetical protein
MTPIFVTEPPNSFLADYIELPCGIDNESAIAKWINYELLQSARSFLVKSCSMTLLKQCCDQVSSDKYHVFYTPHGDKKTAKAAIFYFELIVPKTAVTR